MLLAFERKMNKAGKLWILAAGVEDGEKEERKPSLLHSVLRKRACLATEVSHRK